MKAARLFVVLLAACSSGRSDRERLGDVAWHEGRWSDALADYRAAGDAPRLTAKVADAALQARSLSESAEAWAKLGTDAPERAAEAASGLARVADAAEQDGKGAVLAQAVAGLRRVAPAWPLGRMVTRMGGGGVVRPADVPDVVPAMLVAAASRGVADSLLLVLAGANRARGACDRAVPILEDVVRRTAAQAMRDTAAFALDSCELGLGLAALQSARADDAERWFDRVSARLPSGAAARRAVIGLGDARLRQNDTVAARQAWQSLVTADTAPDSLMQLALVRLQSLMPVTAPDTGTLHPVRP